MLMGNHHNQSIICKVITGDQLALSLQAVLLLVHLTVNFYVIRSSCMKVSSQSLRIKEEGGIDVGPATSPRKTS